MPKSVVVRFPTVLAEEAQNNSNRQSGPTRFTDAFLRDLRVENGRKDRLVFDTACPGLGVRVTAKGTKTFVAQWTDPATRRKVRERLGVWGSITIDQARAAARARLGDVSKGINPKAERMRLQADAERERRDVERKRAESAYTLKVLVEEWAALHLARKKPRYAAEAVRAIHHGLPELISRPAAQINRADAVDALDKIVKAGKGRNSRAYYGLCPSLLLMGCETGQGAYEPFRGSANLGR